MCAPDWIDSLNCPGVCKRLQPVRRDGHDVARCTVARLMRGEGLQGVVRGGPRVRTTTPDTAADRPLDLVRRQFVAERPNQFWAADFTYVATWRGVVYVAFVIDVFSLRIVSWRAHTAPRSELVLNALEQALHDRENDEALIHHRDRGVQYLSVRYSERLADAGIAPSVGSRGDSYDNALAESVMGLYKPEMIHRDGPWRGFDDVEYATHEWVAWFNTQPLVEPLGYLPPTEYEAQYHRTHAAHAAEVATN